MNGLKKFLENICTFYLSGTEYHSKAYDGPFSMIQSIEDLESLLEHLSEEEIHDTPIYELSCCHRQRRMCGSPSKLFKKGRD